MGALLGGLLYKYGKKLPFAYIGEVVGTGIIGGMLSYPVAYLVMGNKAAALFTFVVPFYLGWNTHCHYHYAAVEEIRYAWQNEGKLRRVKC